MKEYIFLIFYNKIFFIFITEYIFLIFYYKIYFNNIIYFINDPDGFLLN
uniref:Uncharacterized protein n=1 Tax=viral metagenome TaxID=1070528 RepID=A0A6C0AD15_9ZZZZ